MSTPAPTIILATSAARPEYRRDFLTCLASPSGHHVAFSYKKSWFGGGLLDGELAGRAATIVFCDVGGSPPEFDYVALRHVVILETVPAATDRLQPDAVIAVVFQLGRLVAVDGDLDELRAGWNATLGVLDHRPRPRGHPQEQLATFVFEHPALAESPTAVDERQSWRALAEHLGGCPSLDKAFFFRIDGVRKPSDGGSGAPLPREAVGSLHNVYPLRPSSEYEVALDAYSKSGENPYSQAIAATSSSDKLAVQAITQSSAGRASQAVLVLRAGEVQRSQVATLIIQGAERFEHLVPRVELAARIEPNRLLAIGLMILIAIGVVLGGLPKGALGLADPALYAVKLAGGLLVGAVTLFALGRVPGIGK